MCIMSGFVGFLKFKYQNSQHAYGFIERDIYTFSKYKKLF